MAINKVIFGSDFRPKIKEKLEWRQSYAASSDPLAPIGTTTDYETEFGGKADLSSRTPFARMWTSVQLFYEEKPRTITTYKTGEEGDTVWVNPKNANNLSLTKKEGWPTRQLYEDEEIIEEGEGTTSSFNIPLEKTVYVIGNHIYNSMTNNKGVNQYQRGK